MHAMLIRLETDKHAALKVIAKREGRSLANMIRLILDRYMAADAQAEPEPEPPPSRDWQARVYGGKRD